MRRRHSFSWRIRSRARLPRSCELRHSLHHDGERPCARLRSLNAARGRVWWHLGQVCCWSGVTGIVLLPCGWSFAGRERPPDQRHCNCSQRLTFADLFRTKCTASNSVRRLNSSLGFRGLSPTHRHLGNGWQRLPTQVDSVLDDGTRWEGWGDTFDPSARNRSVSST